MGQGLILGIIIGTVGWAIGSAIQKRETAIGCRITHVNGDFVDLLCSQREFDQIRGYFPREAPEPAVARQMPMR